MDFVTEGKNIALSCPKREERFLVKNSEGVANGPKTQVLESIG
jgi:hypothetical protein